MGSEFSTPTVVVGGATVAAGIVGAALYAKQHPDTPEVASPAVPAEKDKGKGKGAAGGGRKRKGGSSLAGSTKRLGGASSEKNDDTPPALAAQAALFDASAEKGRSSAMEDIMASTTSVASKSSRRKRGRKPKAPTPAEQKEVEAEEEEEEEEEEEATPEPTMVASSSAFGGSSKDKRGQNKFSSLLAESQYVSAKPSMDASWLQVDKARAASAKRRKQQQQKAAAEVSSDAGLTASATGDESHSERGQSNSMQALAGKLGHVQPKTQVDDMLPSEPPISRVMRVESAPDDDLLHSTDADAEEEGWGIVRRRRASPNPTSTPPAEPAPSSDELNKEQRRREARKDATKVAKADAEADRLKRLAQHKKEQERAKIEEMRKKELSAPKKGKEAKISGGMKAVVQDGKLVWE